MGSRSGLGSTGDFFHGFHLQLRTRSVFVTSSRLFRGNQFASKGILEIFTDDSDSVSIFRFLIKENIAERKVQPLRVSKCSTSGLFTLHLLFRLLPNAVCCNYIPREPHTIFFPCVFSWQQVQRVNRVRRANCGARDFPCMKSCTASNHR